MRWLNGTPGFFFEVDDNTAGMGPDALRVWEFKPNWSTPLSSTFGLDLQPNYTMTVASFFPARRAARMPIVDALAHV